MNQRMHYGASHLIFQSTTKLINNMTFSEGLLWNHLSKNKRKEKFRR